MIFRKKFFLTGSILLFVFALLLNLSQGGAQARTRRQNTPTPRPRRDFVDDELVVIRENRVEKIKINPRERAIRRTQLLQEKDVLAVEPNYFAKALDTDPVNDPYFKYQWNFEQIKVPAAWDKSTGQGVVVAVVDSGITKVKDLRRSNFVAGHDFVDDDNDPADENGHGTHIAGTIAQSTNNRYGTAGIAHGAKLMPVRVLDRRGRGSYWDIYQGIVWAVDNGAEIINLSLGGRFDSSLLERAVKYAYERGVTIIAAAGNDGNVGADEVLYPAAYDDYVLAVGAVRYDKQRASYSNGGDSLDLVAPGGDLSVDQNSDGYGDGILQQTLRGFYFYQGTSMAAAHVSGVAALLQAHLQNPQPLGLRKILRDTAEDLGPGGWDKEYGWGLIDAAAALGESTPVRTATPTPQPTATPVPTSTPTPTLTPTLTLTPTPTPVPDETGNENNGFWSRICRRYPWVSRCQN